MSLPFDKARSHFNLGNALMSGRRYAEAVPCYEKALAIEPGFAGALNNLGAALGGLGRHAEAVDRYREALAAAPDRADSHINLGTSLAALNRQAEAIASYETAIGIAPDSADAHNNLGAALNKLHRYPEAIACLKKALALKSAFAEARLNLGGALAATGRHAEALREYENALAAQPDFAQAQFNRAAALLRLGRYAEGWSAYESRWQFRGHAPLPQDCRPLWLGDEDIAGKVLLIQFEQGLGDALQMLRYVPLLEKRGASCLIQAPETLRSLLARSFPRARIVNPGECPADAQLRIPVMSLPLALRTLEESMIPSEAPYLIADEGRKSKWASRLAPGHGLLVGLAWRGNPGHRNDRNRSAALEELEFLFSRADIRFVTLQKNLTPAECDFIGARGNVIALDRELESFDETAAVVCNLDAVVSVDTALVHLAGALGRTVHVMLAFNPEWRWLLERRDSAWYPTVRLFRQTAAGVWTDVVAGIAAALPRPSGPGVPK